MMTDPIADMLTRIRNAARVRKTKISLPSSRLKVRIAELLRDEGFLSSVSETTDGPRQVLELEVKYLPNGTQPVLRGVRRESKPGQRVYVSYNEIPRVQSGQGVAILSTSKGVITDRQARKQKVGGELICAVW
jgi:small subunit ribosomal protein S8